MPAIFAPAPFATAIVASALVTPIDVVPPRVEHFVLELEEAGATRAVGTLTMRRCERLDEVQLELDFVLARAGDRPDQHVWHVERHRRASRELTWREVGPGSGRTLAASAARRAHALEVREWTVDDSLRSTIALTDGALLPVEAFEVARSADAVPGELVVFDPRSRTCERLAVSTEDADPLRTVEMRRTDETLFARLVFRSRELEGVTLQDGGVIARRVESLPGEDAR